MPVDGSAYLDEYKHSAFPIVSCLRKNSSSGTYTTERIPMDELGTDDVLISSGIFEKGDRIKGEHERKSAQGAHGKNCEYCNGSFISKLLLKKSQHQMAEQATWKQKAVDFFRSDGECKIVYFGPQNTESKPLATRRESERIARAPKEQKRTQHNDSANTKMRCKRPTVARDRSAPEKPSADLNEYELDRERRIQANRAKMIALGILDIRDSLGMPNGVHDGTKKKRSRGRPRADSLSPRRSNRQRVEKTPTGPVRASGRLVGRPKVDYVAQNGEDTSDSEY